MESIELNIDPRLANAARAINIVNTIIDNSNARLVVDDQKFHKIIPPESRWDFNQHPILGQELWTPDYRFIGAIMSLSSNYLGDIGISRRGHTQIQEARRMPDAEFSNYHGPAIVHNF